jgi:hypothetical protein
MTREEMTMANSPESSRFECERSFSSARRALQPLKFGLDQLYAFAFSLLGHRFTPQPAVDGIIRAIRLRQLAVRPDVLRLQTMT